MNSVHLVVVEFDLHNDEDEVVVFRLCNQGPFITTVDNERVQFEPRLYLPIKLGVKMNGEQYGTTDAGANSGLIDFSLSEDIWPWLDYHWQGSEYRILVGEVGNVYDDLILVNKGQVDDLSHDTITASVKTTDNSSKLDKSLITDLYGEDELEAIVGLPKPRLFGQAFSIEPVLVDQINLIYQISAWGLESVDVVRVGGIEWEKVVGEPEQGEWSENIIDGTITLGSVALGGEIRANAKAVGWDELTTAELIRQVVEIGGGEVNEQSMYDLDISLPGLIGYYASEAINILDMLDEIALGTGVVWWLGADGKIMAKIIQAPNVVQDFDFTSVNVDKVELVSLIPPVWRLRIEYARNWQPGTQFFTSVLESDQAVLEADGIIAEPFEDEGIKIAEPKAVDLAIVRSLFNDVGDAILMRDRLSLAWGVRRRVYDVTVFERYDNFMINVLEEIVQEGLTFGGEGLTFGGEPLTFGGTTVQENLTFEGENLTFGGENLTFGEEGLTFGETVILGHTIQNEEEIEIYDSINLSYMMVSGNFNVHSIEREIGSSVKILQVWG